MVLLGLSILVASITFIYYRRPPFALALLEWIHRPSLVRPPSIPLDDVAKQQKQPRDESIPAPPKVEEWIVKDHEADRKRQEAPTTAEDDRRAMPPPPLFAKPSSPTRPRASASAKTAIPLLNLATSPEAEAEDDDDDTDTLPPPCFPALNSAQRAKPPALNPPSVSTLTPTPAAGGGLMAPPSRGASSSMAPPSRGTSSLMPPPSRPSPLPNRGPPSTSTNTLSPPPTHSAPPSKPRKKVLLAPGHSPLDWARLTSSPSFLSTQPASLIRVPPSMLKQHNGRRRKVPSAADAEAQYVTADAWTVLGGKVYNISPYLPYHPGGEPELLRVAGRDGTRLFGEVHPWVNWEGMLEACLVGIAVEEEVVVARRTDGGLEDMD